MKLSLPIHIQKKSKRYFFDTVNNQYIRADNIEDYLKERKEIVSGAKDKAIINARWDLKLD